MLHDRGRIEAGLRVDLIIVDGRDGQPNVVATIANGRIVHLTDSGRLH